MWKDGVREIWGAKLAALRDLSDHLDICLRVTCLAIRCFGDHAHPSYLLLSSYTYHGLRFNRYL